MGSWYEPGGTMYSHCLASIAICEAYAMTADSRLQDPAQLSLNFLVQTQDRSGGGWQPNSFPDMGGPTGGRLYATSMSAMILEVYYRHMPLYTEQAVEVDIEEKALR